MNNRGFYTNDAVQTIQPGASAVFTLTVVPNENVGHIEGTGLFELSGGPRRANRCNCCNRQVCKRYPVNFGANIAIPTGGTVEAISVAIAVGGATVPASTMIVTPAAVEQYFNVSTDILVPIVCGCCQTVTVTNTSAQPILMQNASLTI